MSSETCYVSSGEDEPLYVVVALPNQDHVCSQALRSPSKTVDDLRVAVRRSHVHGRTRCKSDSCSALPTRSRAMYDINHRDLENLIAASAPRMRKSEIRLSCSLSRWQLSDIRSRKEHGTCPPILPWIIRRARYPPSTISISVGSPASRSPWFRCRVSDDPRDNAQRQSFNLSWRGSDCT